ncbi:hypothetical protein WA026_007728 [Henosepilachna vigintioctopunctata]|uniref:Neprilysin n=1 Tax=Henosepilachna vigintioctopunctata TaxID=420089 RepID=A0AAW1U5C6_9CUCU
MPDSPMLRGEKGTKKRTGCEKKLIVAVCVLGILALILVLFIVLRKTCEKDVEECTTKHCVKAAAELLEYVNLKEDPCKNFYMYTCGSYFKNAVKKDYTSPWTTTQALFKNELKSLMVDPIRLNKDTNAQILLKQYYHACMNETKIEEDDNRTFMKAIDELGGWPLINETDWDSTSFRWDDWYIKAKRMGLPVIGFFYFQRMETNYNDTILKVTGPHMEYETQFSSKDYLDLMRKISDAFDTPDRKQDNKDVLNLIRKLYKYRDELDIVDENLNDEYVDYDYEGEKEDFIVSDMKNLSETCPNIKWLKILNGISGNSSQFDNSSEVSFHVGNMKKYCATLDKLFNNTSPKVIANYYIWNALEDFSDRFLTCTKACDKRFKYVKETVYVRKKTDVNVRNQLREMIEIMKDLFVEHLKTCDWMDDKTRIAAIEKAQLIQSVIGADEEFYDIDKFDKILGIDGLKFTSDNMFEIVQQKTLKEDHHFFETLYGPIPDNWKSFFENAVEVNAFFAQAINVMIIPAPILTSIFFNKKFPAFMNYGAMGSTVGHELMHGFSKSAREVLLENDEYIDWWTNTTAEMFDQKVQCVIDEYERIPFRYRLNGTLTLDENLADYVGADIGYEAYKRYIQKHGAEKKLPGVPMTPEQIYWVQTATNFCFRKLDDNDVDYEEEDAHAIPTFRVMAPARNSKHFAEAFNCPVGSFMNPEKKCKIL